MNLLKEYTESFSLRENAKQRFLKVINQIQIDENQHGQTSYILVIDAFQLSILSSFLNMSDLLKNGILAIEKLELVRKPFPNYQAIYFISPSSASIDQLVNDFKSGKDYLYKKAHIFFSSKLKSKKHLQKIAQNPTLVKRIGNIKEFNHEFYFEQSNVFNLHIPNSLETLFSYQNSKDCKIMTETIVQQLKTVLPSLGYVYEIGVVYRNQSKICEIISKSLAEEIDQFLTNQKQQQNQMHSQNNHQQQQLFLNYEAGKTYIVIIDRSLDVVTPVAHDFYFESLVYDLLNVKENKIKIEVQVKDENRKQKNIQKMVDLGKVNDIVWKKYKHKHIGEALEGIPEELNGFIQTNNAARMAQAKNGGEQNIEQIMAVLPSYQEFLQQFQMNIHLSEAISNKVMELNLKDIGELEQALCTGILNNGKQTSSQQLIQDFIQFSINQKFRSETDKLRVAILIFITLELNNKDANQIYNCLNQEQKQTINNLQWLGIQKQDPQNIQRTTKRVDQNIRRYAKRLLKNQKQDLCRHTPYIKLVFEQIFNEIIQSENQQLNFQRLSLECININEKHNKPQFNQTVQEPKNNQGTNKKPKQYQNNSDEDLDEEHEENKNLITKDTIKKQIQKLKQEENDSLSGKLGYNNSENLKNPKVIAFLVGGLTYPEIRILDNLSKEYKYESINFVMGGTQILNQQQFIDSLNNMAHFQQ